LREDFWTLSIIPHCGKSPRIYRISRWHIYLCCSAVSLVVLALSLFSFEYFRRQNEEDVLRDVLAENRSLHDRLGEMGKRVVEFEGEMDKVSTMEEEFRAIAGLAGVEPEIREVGVGGPSRESYRETPGNWLNGNTGKKVEYSEERLATLFRQADLVHQSLVETVEQMEYNTEKFARTPSIWPTSGNISSRFGARTHPIFGGVRPHEGIDIFAPKGTPILATADGRIERAGWKVGYGLTLLIDHDYGYETFYAHCSKLKVKKGDRVNRGDVIAMVGNTGVTTGSHLHYEVIVNGRSVNPSNYILGNAVPD
jgi:murein DD-endopeptidase MepM/ murein hydrolase activator NlpD